MPQAARRLSMVNDPMLGLAMQVIQPPQTIDTTGGQPVLYLAGIIDPAVNWQAAAIAALRPSPLLIANPRRERPNPAQDDSVAAARWRERHLIIADIALFWFFGDNPDPMSLVELGTRLDATTRLAAGAAPNWPGRAALAARLRSEEPELNLFDSLDATIARAAELIAEPFGNPFRASRLISDPDAVACVLREAIMRVDLSRDEPFDIVLADAASAAAIAVDPQLLTRLYVAVDRVRLDETDPLGWAELHDVAAALQPS